MTVLDRQTEDRLRQFFKRYLNRFMIGVWRLGLAWMVNIWPEVGGRIMVITHTGRKSGLRRRTPVNYALVDGELYCLAGFGSISDWYRNILADPRVEVWLPDSWWAGVAEDVSDDPRRLDLMREIVIASGFVAYLFGFNPHTMSDEALDGATASYRLIYIRREEPRTGPGGPGDLAWVWPVAALLLLLFRPRRRKA